jgi:Flp pilus assembly pilin Flp
MYISRKHQSTIETAALLGIAALVLIIIFSYLKQSLQGRYRQAAHTFFE